MDMERFLYPLFNLKNKAQQYSILSVLPFLNTSIYSYLSVYLPTYTNFFQKGRQGGYIRIHTRISEKQKKKRTYNFEYIILYNFIHGTTLIFYIL